MMKTTDWLRDQLPSANELLNSPKLRPLVDSLSHNEVALRVRAFLEETHSQLQHKLSDLQLPPFGELVDRVADRIQRPQQSQARRAINATGTIFDPARPQVPLADTVIERMEAAARDFTMGGDLQGDGESSSGRNLAEVRHALRRSCPVDDLVVFHSYSAAEYVSLIALGPGPLVVAEDRQVSGGILANPAALADSPLTLRHIELRGGMSPDEMASAFGTDATGVFFRANVAAADQESAALPGDDVIQAASADNRLVVENCRSASLVDLSSLGLSGTVSLNARVRAGASLLLVDGGRWIGGPSCGIAVGRSDVIARVKAHPLTATMAASSLTLLALAATLELYADRTRPELIVPVLQLLSTPLENLQLRAERLSAQIGDEAEVEATAVACRSRLDAEESSDEGHPTWAVALRPRNGDVEALQLRLASAPYPVLARKESGQLVVDLRTVFARQDLRLLAEIKRCTGPVVGDESAKLVEPPSMSSSET